MTDSTQVWATRVIEGRIRRARGAGDRGAVLVEAALITLPFFLLIFAVIEVGMQMASLHAATGSVKAGSRSASTAGSDLSADHLILQSVKGELSGLPRGRQQIVRIVVYRSGGSGQPPTERCRDGSPQHGNCNVYTAADLDRPASEFGCKGSAPDRYWCPDERKTALTAASGGPPDYIGVYVVVRHTRVVPLVGNDKLLYEHSVNRLEPSKR